MPSLLSSASGLAITAGGLALSSLGATLQSFNIVNTEASASSGFIRVGLPFAYGDVPSGSIPKIEKAGVEVTTVQFDERTFWPDGSLRFCVLHMRDVSFSASESRTYDVSTKSAAYSNAGTFTTSDISTNSDLKTLITSLTQPNQSNTNDHTASLNTALGTATRITKIHSGPVCDGWMVWQYYNDDSDSIDDAHLKAVWYVDLWNDGSDTLNSNIEFGCKTCLNNWTTANKDRHDYTLTLKDGATTVETYASVQHPYHAEWLTARKDNDVHEGKRHWRGSNRPTLLYQPDQAYWILTGLVPPLDYTGSTVSATDYNSPFVPLSAINHRSNIDGTGAYQGRGVIVNSDATAFLSQTAAHTRYARVNAHAGLHVGYHYRSDDTRDRSGVAADAYNNFTAEGSDEANTIISLILEPKTSGEYTFTSDGMPAAKHAYADYRTTATYDGGYASYTGGSGVWNLSGGASHGVNYSYFMYLLEGERYFLDATIDLAMNCSHALVGQDNGRDRAIGYNNASRQTEGSIPATFWTGLADINENTQERSVGWAAVMRGSAYAVIPDNDVQANCYRAWSDHNVDYMLDSISYYPADQTAWGIYMLQEDMPSPWMLAFQTLGIIHMHNCMRTTDSQSIADFSSKYPTAMWSNASRGYFTESYRFMPLSASKGWHVTDNPFQAAGDAFAGWTDVTATASTDIITYTDPISLNSTPQVSASIANGDRVLFMNNSSSSVSSSRNIPAGITEGTVYYVINRTSTTFQVSLSPGGAAVDITADESNASCIFNMAEVASFTVADTTGNGGLGVPNVDDYSAIMRAALVAANKMGYVGATSGLISNADTFLQNMTAMSASEWYTWRYA